MRGGGLCWQMVSQRPEMKDKKCEIRILVLQVLQFPSPSHRLYDHCKLLLVYVSGKTIEGELMDVQERESYRTVEK